MHALLAEIGREAEKAPVNPAGDASLSPDRRQGNRPSMQAGLGRSGDIRMAGRADGAAK